MNAVLSHLLWKDTRMIVSLASVILAGTLLFNLLMWLTMLMFGVQSNINLAVPLWILMPNLMALGAPPMLVGSEEESGTLGWLRSLPVPWPMVVLSKTLVAVAAVILSWAVSSLLLWMTLAMWGALLPPTVQPMLQRDEILGLAFFTFQLLFTGFFLAYLCRSPIRSVILVLPAMIGLFCAGKLLANVLDPVGFWWPVSTLIAIAYMILLVAAQFLPASWRLARRRSRRATSPPPALTEQRSQPYAFNSLVSVARPSRWRVLLWQAWRQQAGPLVGLSVIVALCAAAIHTRPFYEEQDWLKEPHQILIFSLSALLILTCAWMGCLCFYPDSISGRHFFFADRGLSKRLIWWSRMMAPMLVLSLALLIIFVSTPFESTQFRLGLLGCCILGFACGLLSSMWMTRSTLAFFVGPMLLLVIWVIHVSLIEPYHRYFGYIAIAALPLLFASWRLMDDWSKHAQSWATQLRVMGYLLLAIVSIPVSVIAVRFGTMPGPMPQWRAKMLAQPMPEAVAEFRWPTVQSYLEPWLATHPLPIEVEGRLINSNSANLIRSATQKSLILHRYDQLGLVDAARSAQRMFEWSKAARLAVLRGEINPAEVLTYAESDEMVAISQLYNLVMSDAYSLSAEAVAAIRDALDAMAPEELREKSWRMSLAMEWRLYQLRQGRRMFAGEWVDAGYWFPRLEEIRADRNVDWAVHSLLDTPLPDVSFPYRWSADPRLYGQADSPVHFDVGYGPDFKAKIEQELKRRGF